MRTFETFSTPFLTPARIVKNTSAENMRNQNSTLADEAMNPEKYPSAATASALPRRYSNRYFSTQPPMTE